MRLIVTAATAFLGGRTQPVAWPVPVVIRGSMYVVYELHLTNLASQDLLLKRIEVLDSRGATLVEFRDSELRGMVGRLITQLRVQGGAFTVSTEPPVVAT